MRSFLRSSVSRTSIVAIVLAAGCTTIGCGDDTSGVTPGEDTGTVEETGDETSLPPDSGEPDTAIDDTGSTEDSTTDSSPDSSPDASPDSSTDDGSADSAAEAAAETSVDSGTADTATDDAADAAETAPACTQGALCSDKTICKTGACTPCAADSECSTASAGTLCISGKCETAECKPPSATGCSATGSLCCATASSAGKCIAPVTGKTTCCTNTECAAAPGGLTKCDTTTNTCTCPDPTPGTFYVATTGNDTSGNGSASCPFKTVTKAVTTSVGATVATTIVLQKAATGVATYGTGCTGGAPCDTTPITVPATITNGLLIKGAGNPSDVLVTGGGNSVFLVSTAGVGFESMTIVPTKTGATNAGGHGLEYNYATAGTEGVIKNVVINGSYAGGSGTGTSIYLKGVAAPTIGTGVILTGGFNGIRAEGTSAGKITGGPTAAQTIISNFGGACVYVTSTSTTAAPSLTASSTGATKDIIVRDCGAIGAIAIDTSFAGTGSSFSGVQVLRSTAGPTFPGLHLLKAGRASMSSSTITGLLDVGVWAEQTSTLSSTAGLVVTSNGFGGVLLGGLPAASATGSPAIDLTGASIRSNTGGDGIHCNVVGGSVKLRDTAVLANSGSGLRLAGNCTADLGSASASGGNTFNTATQANAESGICSNAGGTIVAPARWKCAAPPASGCASGLPENVTPSGMFRCNTGKDVTVGAGTTWNPVGTHECCNSVP